MKIKILFTNIFLIIIALNLQSQTTGYMGKKFAFEFCTGGFPLKWNSYNGSSTLENKKTFFTLCPKTSISILVSPKTALGIGFQTSPARGVLYAQYYDSDKQVESCLSTNVKIKTYNFSFFFENALSEINQRTGLYYRLGLSFCIATNYQYSDTDIRSNSFYSPVESHTMPELFGTELNQTFSTIGAMWEFGSRYPVSRSIFLHYSVNGYLYHGIFLGNNSLSYSSSYIKDLMKKQSAFGSLLSINFGISIAI